MGENKKVVLMVAKGFMMVQEGSKYIIGELVKGEWNKFGVVGASVETIATVYFEDVDLIHVEKELSMKLEKKLKELGYHYFVGNSLLDMDEMCVKKFWRES